MKKIKNQNFLKVMLSIIVILAILVTNLNIYASKAYTVNTSTKTLNIEKISNPTVGEGEADGLVTGGDRETSYSWAMASRGQYLYIGTNRNIIGTVAEGFITAMESAGVTEEMAWTLINSMTNNEIPTPTTQDGGEIFKCNMSTGEISKIYTAEAGVAFRMAIEFDGDLYFASYSSTAGADNYIYKIDENDNMSVAFTSSNGTSLRASCIYDGSLLFGGVDARIELAEGDENCQKLAILKKDANDDTKWDRIADYKDFKEYVTDSAVFNSVASPIWDICTYNGYIYATIPNTVGVVMFRGHPAEGSEVANEYGWYWEEVIGKTNGVNNIGLADSAEGYSSEDEAGLLTVSGTPIVFNNKLYLFDFDNTITSEVLALTGLVAEIAQQDVKPSDYLSAMYTTLQHPQKLWCYDDATGKFNEVQGFSEYMSGNCLEYIWRADIYHDELYISTMDSAVLYNYITNLKGEYFVELTDEEINSLTTQIDSALALLDGAAGSLVQNSEEIKAMLENLKVMIQEYQTISDDNKSFYEFVIKYEEVINQMASLGAENSAILAMAGAEFQELYNKVDWEGLKMYSYIAKTLENNIWGFDLLKTSDGENFELVTDSGFNDKYNYGGRSVYATDYGLFVGTANPFFGTQLWKITDGTENPGTEDPGTEDPGTENPGTEDPGTENPGTEDPGTEDPGTEDPGTEDPGTEDPGTENPGTEDPGTENPGTENPGTEDPGTENPGTEDPGTEDPGTENPGTENPGTEDPGTENPGTDDPDIDLPLTDDEKDQIQNEWQNQLDDPEQLVSGLDELNNNVNLSGNKQYSSVAQTKLPDAGEYSVFIGIGIGALVIVMLSAYKYFRYKNIDKH